MDCFRKRRAALLESCPDDALIIVPSASEMVRSRDVFHPYRQASDFYYLTGLQCPRAMLVLRKEGADSQSVQLFLTERSQEMAIWDGPGLTLESAKRETNADDVFAYEEFSRKLPEYLSSAKTFLIDFAADPELTKDFFRDIQGLALKRRKGSPPTEIRDLSDYLHTQRLVKDEVELAALQRAVDVTVEAHERAMRCCSPGVYEYELQAEIEYIFKKRGTTGPAYSTIVGGGENGCVLHYVQNDSALKSGELCLIDAGAECDLYAADITRTFPVSGKFSPQQADLYDLVLACQKAGIEKARAGERFEAMQLRIVEVLVDGLIDLKLLKGSPESLIAKKAYKDFYMHTSGHWLGLDVHDVGPYRDDEGSVQLKPGMVLTVEPGIYVSKRLDQVDKAWHGIGIRIEDDILVTEHAPEILSASLVKERKDIEALMAEG